MADYNYFPSGQVQTILEERDHDDKFFSEVVQITDAANIDIADYMVDDILNGNTHTIGSAYRRIPDDSRLRVELMDGADCRQTGLPYSVITDHTMYSCAPIKDDHSGEGGYQALPDDDPRRKESELAFRALNMRMEDVATGILEPEPIPAVDSNAFKDYKDRWEDDENLQAEHPTLEEYHASLVEDLEAQQSEIKDISDVNVGIFGTGSTLDDANLVAIYHTMENLYPKLTYHPGANLGIPNFPPMNYLFQYKSGNFIAACGWKSWSHIIRRGRVENRFDTPGEEPEKYRGKSDYEYFWDEDTYIPASSGDPIHQILQANVNEQPGWEYDPGDPDAGTPAEKSGMLQIQVQLQPLDDGTEVYGEIRVWGYGTYHQITGNDGRITSLLATIADGEEGYEGDGTTEIINPTDITVDDGATYITQITTDGDGYDPIQYSFEPGYDEAYFQINGVGELTAQAPLDYAVKDEYYFKVKLVIGTGLTTTTYTNYKVTVLNTNNEPAPPPTEDPFATDNTRDKGYSLILFPIEMTAAKQVPFFKRERFLRESVTLFIYAVKKVKIKWYEKGWFKVLLFVVSVVFSLVTSGASLSWYAVVTAVKEAVIQMIVALLVAALLNGVIDSPLLAAVLAIIIAIYAPGSTIKFDNMLADIASLMMEGANQFSKTYTRITLEKLEEDFQRVMEEINSMQSKVADMIDEMGASYKEDASELIRFLAQLVPGETHDEYQVRTLNVDNAIIDSVDPVLDLDSKLKTF